MTGVGVTAVVAPVTPGRRLLARMRGIMGAGSAQLPEIVAVVAHDMSAEVCSAYALRAGEILELRATYG